MGTNGANNELNKCAENIANPLMSCFFSLPPKQFSLLSSIIGILIIDCLTPVQQNSLGNFIVGLGQNILTAAAQSELIKETAPKNDKVTRQLNMIKQQICMLEKELGKEKE